MNVLIVDDEANNRTLVTKMLEDFPIIKEIKLASSAIEAITILKSFKADIVFLDIEMPGGSGFDFLEAIPERDFKVVFITAHDKYAIKAIKEQAYDYLLKPIDRQQFEQLIYKLSDIVPENNGKDETRDRIIISTQEETFFLKKRDIIRVSSAGNYCIYHLINGRDIVASYILKRAYEDLSEDIFFRVHNSHIINFNFVEKMNKVDGYMIIMKDGTKIPLSRRRKDEFMVCISGILE